MIFRMSPNIRNCCGRIRPSLFLISRSCSHSPNKPNRGIIDTVDQSEINLFSSLSKQWWDENGTLKALHAMNDLRVQFIRSGLINSGKLKEADTFNTPLYLKGLKISDVGCGGGILSLTLAKLGCDLTGLEPSQELVNVAKEAVERFKPAGKTEFISTSVEDYAKKHPDSFDAVVCSEVIEHVSQKEGFLEACCKMLKPEGSIFFTTPNRTLISRFLTIFVAENVLRLLEVGTHQYEKYITPEELSQILLKNSCETKLVHGFMYSPVTNSFCWTSYNHVSYALHAVKKPQ